jgi:GNAT superfamily N-acetyltransferase
MYKDMGLLAGDASDDLQTASAQFFRDAMAKGDWYGWVVTSAGSVIAGGVMHLTLMPPRNRPGGGFVNAMLQGLIMNIYVEPDWRRKGVASELMAAILAFGREKGAASVTLHASLKGKPLYEKMGFLPTHEMRLFL